MPELDEIDFGADTDAIRRWLAKRATYAGELGDPVHGGRHRVDPPGTIDPSSLTVPNTREAGRDVLEALVAPEPPVAKRWPLPYKPPVTEEATRSGADGTDSPKPPVTPPPRTGTTPGQRSPYASTPEHEEELTSARSTNAVFRPRNAAQHTTALVLVSVAAMTVGAGYRAYHEPTIVNQGLTVLLALLTLVVWGIRATTSRTELAVIRGQLEMIRDGKFEVVDLASIYTPVAVQGSPGRRGWKVLIERHDQPLLVIDASMVDPHRFTAVLHRVRPDLRPGAATRSAA